jgi:hypothetical protein
MARYYFHVHDGIDMPDDEGTDFVDDGAARAAAIVAAGEMLRDLGIKYWEHSDWSMEVTDQVGATVCKLDLCSTRDRGGTR